MIITVDIPRSGWAHVTIPYAVKEVLKTSVPENLRTWNPSLKAWDIHPRVIDELIAAMREGPGVEVRVHDGRDIYPYPWVVEAFKAASPEQWPSLRRALQSVWHPDRPGGDAGVSEYINRVADAAIASTSLTRE